MNLTKNKEAISRYYVQKAKSSFKARFELLLYYRISQGNISEITTTDLDNFAITDHLDSLNEYIQEYLQREDNKSHEIRGRVIEDIYQDMKKWKERNKSSIDHLLMYYNDYAFNTVFPMDEFVEMVEQNQKCHYCQITKEQIDFLINSKKLFKKHITRGWSLEIDRKEPNLEYTKENCVMCCYWCNNAKTDEFTYSEFKKIGKVIEKIWHDRLNN